MLIVPTAGPVGPGTAMAPTSSGSGSSYGRPARGVQWHPRESARAKAWAQSMGVQWHPRVSARAKTWAQRIRGQLGRLDHRRYYCTCSSTCSGARGWRRACCARCAFCSSVAWTIRGSWSRPVTVPASRPGTAPATPRGGGCRRSPPVNQIKKP